MEHHDEEESPDVQVEKGRERAHLLQTKEELGSESSTYIDIDMVDVHTDQLDR